MAIQNFQKFPQIIGDDADDTELLLDMANKAKNFIESFSWCPPFKEIYLADGVGGIVGVFFVDFLQKIQNTDSSLWVVVGDIPSAYLVVEQNDTPAEILEKYCQLMDDWVSAVEKSGDLGEVYPVDAEPTIDNAEILKKRISSLRENIFLSDKSILFK